MASYFDEHDCKPLNNGEAPDHFLHFARLILDGGYWQDMQLEFSNLFGSGEQPPPAAKNIVENLKTDLVKKDEMGQCPVCLKEWSANEERKQLSCKHRFHSECILPWLEKNNSCPLCRHELPTDDVNYEEFKRQKSREKNRKDDLEILHDSMFS